MRYTIRHDIALITYVISVVYSAVFVASCNAESNAQGLAHVFVEVLPNVSLQAVAQQPSDIIGVSSSRTFAVLSRFEISANTDQLHLGCMASDLYRAAVPTSVDRIKVNFALGCEIEMPMANPMGGLSARGQFLTDAPLNLAGFEAWPTNMIGFQSFQSGFSMPAYLRVHYVLDRANLPQGQYGGVVKLVALIFD